MTNPAATTTSGQPLGLSRRPSPGDALFERCRKEGRAAFIGYLPYGFPDPDTSIEALRAMVAHGVDAVDAVCTHDRRHSGRSL